MSRATTPLSVEEIVDRFHQTFRDSENIVLVGGFPEPLYVPSENGGPDEIRYTCDWVRSVLHEVAHWCLVGRKRRRLVDYGFWYHPNGRTQDQQNLFFRVEARPQALEWIFALVAG
ncbi:MAG TPA: elongation factor P hydroxylase, partial [Planctomycetota bacterium]|nr:elongation factor P hydroxylase [Planctomycetota bacterium]